MRTFARYLPAVACGAMLVFVCIPMIRNMHKGRSNSADTDTQKEIAELRDEIQRLKFEPSADAPTKKSV